jgi:hypothetical protein
MLNTYNRQKILLITSTVYIDILLHTGLCLDRNQMETGRNIVLQLPSLSGGVASAMLVSTETGRQENVSYRRQSIILCVLKGTILQD